MTPGEQIAELEQRAVAHRVVAEGCAMAWRRFGDGPDPLLLLHGGHGSWLHWVHNVDALLAPGRSVWLPDLPGFGASDALPGAPRDPQRMARLVEVLVGCIDQLVGAGTAIDLAGFSFGGLTAAHVVAKRGGVRRLALLGAAGHGSPRRPASALREWRLPDARARQAALRHNLQAHMIHDAERIDDLSLAVHSTNCEATRFRSKEVSLASSLAGTLGEHDGAMLALWGEHDVTCTPEDATQRLAAGRSRTVQATIAGAGHWVQYEAAEAVNLQLRDWFAPT